MNPMIQQANNSSVEVEIFDQTYSLCGSEPDYILKLAEYLDAKMRSLANETHTTNGEQLAVLAAFENCRRIRSPEKKAGWRRLRFFHVEPQLRVRRVGEQDARRRREGNVWPRGAPDDRRRPTAHPGETRTTPYQAVVRETAIGDREWRTQLDQRPAQGTHRLWQDPRLESASAVQKIARAEIPFPAKPRFPRTLAIESRRGDSDFLA